SDWGASTSAPNLTRSTPPLPRRASATRNPVCHWRLHDGLPNNRAHRPPACRGSFRRGAFRPEGDEAQLLAQEGASHRGDGRILAGGGDADAGGGVAAVSKHILNSEVGLQSFIG